jgi:hypothetical protein
VVGYRADGGVVEASFKPNCSERSEAVRNPDPEANLVPEAAPTSANRRPALVAWGRSLAWSLAK